MQSEHGVALRVPTMTFLKPSLAATMCTAPYRWVPTMAFSKPSLAATIELSLILNGLHKHIMWCIRNYDKVTAQSVTLSKLCITICVRAIHKTFFTMSFLPNRSPLSSWESLLHCSAVWPGQCDPHSAVAAPTVSWWGWSQLRHHWHSRPQSSHHQ